LETWNREEDPTVSVARARVGVGITTRRHRLHDTVERYLILSGSGEVEVGDLPAQLVGPGDLVYVPPGCPQRIANMGAADLVFLAVCTPRFVPDAYEDMESSH
jgi:mannose-6-phosphate isomerase-like protein (cupin superfamily)